VKFAIVGPGSLGCVVAGVLVRGGHRVTLFGRGRALDLLSKHGVVIHGLEELRVRVPVTDRLEDLGEPDLLLICTKALGTRDLLDKLRAVPAAAVASLQNGILKDRLLAQAFGPERVLGAATMVSAQRHVDGSVTWAGRGVTYFGEPDGGESGRLRAVVEVWREAGLPAQAVPDIDALEWSKTAMVAGSFAVSVLSRWPMYQVFADPDLCDVFLALVRETATLAAAHGVEIDDYAGLPARAYATLPREEALALLARASANLAGAPIPLRTSMQQDLLAGRPMEVEEVFGSLLEDAARLGVAVPLVTAAYHLLRALDRNRCKGESAPVE
jgi:2-dehydropantoate 2-reductase